MLSLNDDNTEEGIFEDLDPDQNLNISSLQNSCNYYSITELNNLGLNSENFSMLHYNIRSFHKNGKNFVAMTDSINFRFKCIVLTETYNNPNNSQLCKLLGYKEFHVYRPLGEQSGGVSVFCDLSLQATINDSLSMCNEDIEVCVVDIYHKTEKFTIIALYRPPNGSKENFISSLEDILCQIDLVNHTVSILGDFNLNIAQFDRPIIADFTSKLLSKGFISLINKPTRFPDGSLTSNPSILDLIWINKLNIISKGILDYNRSDHLPTYAVLNVKINDGTGSFRVETRPYSESNYLKLCNDLNTTNWDDLLNYDDVESSSKIFVSHLNLLYQKSFPIKVKFISNKRLTNRWVTSDVKKLINKKSEAFKKFRNGEISKEENNRIKNTIGSQINKAKYEYYQKAFENSKNDMKKSWKILGNLLGTNKTRQETISLLDESGEITDEYAIANKFADFFSSVGQNLDTALPRNLDNPCQNIVRHDRSFYMFPVSHEECSKIISKLKLTSTTINEIPVRLFKSIKNLVIYPLVKLINFSFTKGIFPEIFKIARITPIHKKNDPKVCSNYRPISCLPYISKIFERCMANRIVSFFEKFSLFSDKQYGFRKGKSTKDALLNFTESIYDALNAKKHNISILIDLKSAFDTVNIPILLEKFELYGIRGIALSWMKSYLENRKFQVKCKDYLSSIKTVNIGLPQGSILGPICFITYIGNLPQVSNKLLSTLYADDTNFSYVDSNHSSMVSTINTELVKILNWTISNRLTINNSKTELLYFTNRPNDINDGDRIVLNGNILTPVENVRFLGVIIDNKMNFKLHIIDILNKISKHAGILYKIKNELPISARIMYYNSFVLPYLTYNIVHWGNTNPTHLRSLIIIQKRIIRTISGAEYLAHTTPLFHSLDILKIEDLYKYMIVLDTFTKIQEGQYVISHEIDTRNSNQALPKFHRLARCQQSITYNGPKEWNALPEYLRNTTSFPLFKCHLKKYYIQKYST